MLKDFEDREMGRLEVLLKFLNKDSNFKHLVEISRQLKRRDDLPAGCSVFSSPSVRPYIISGLFNRLKLPMLVATSGSGKAQRLVENLANFLPAGSVEKFPAWETFPYEGISPSQQIVGRRLKVLNLLHEKKKVIVVTSIQALLCKIPLPKYKLFKPMWLRKTQEKDLSLLLSGLVEFGYRQTALVEARGEFSHRGGIVDVFPPNAVHPLRIEFFGNSIDSIREFAIADQTSISDLSEGVIFPCREIDIKHPAVKKSLRAFERETIKTATKWSAEDLERIEEGIYFEGIEQYLPLLYPDLGTLTDYFPARSLMVLEETKEVEDKGAEFLEQAAGFAKRAASLKQLAEPLASYYQTLDKALSCMLRLGFTSFDSFKSPPELKFSSLPLDVIPGDLNLAKRQFRRLCQERYITVLVARDQGIARRFKEVLEEWNLESVDLSKVKGKLVGGKIYLAVGDLSAGFDLHQLRICVLSDSCIFERAKRKRQEIQTKDAPSFLKLADFRRGDFVVHESYGIAKYRGLVREKVGGAEWDCMILEYADGNVKVRTDYASRVARYIGAEEKLPRLSRLTGNRWLIAKRRARKSVKRLAINLLKLYAERRASEGYRFSHDQVWQKELEETFPFDETPDQLRAIREVKRDMESAKPMDRLICGDVGYGKTEVAVRASFKAVLDGKQAMVLAPTTILAQQHYDTFCQRLTLFPVEVDVLSRFKVPGEQKKCIEAFSKGRIDVLIGTHRLLSRDVVPKDLGLLIIDEEQRFGVAHKEHLRELRRSVDVVTLSATPIPRTLQMSLAGVRDLSIIDTPPEDRYPIYTFVGEYSEEVIGMAITRELTRGGQVYWVRNRIKEVENTAKQVEKVIPAVKVAVAHGKMPEYQLEQVMFDFLNHKYDVLVCTTIIESGIDIPSVNTIIVSGAENFGLSQLYQLRGRVGRSDRQSYAYFFYGAGTPLTAASLERLKTISEFSDLGSGFKIAMRDLEIRGAGSLLGSEQHGHLAEVGFELYCQLLRREINELKGRPTKKTEEVKIDLLVKAYIPSDYIQDEQLRIEAYRDIAAASSPEEVERVKGKLRDVYGELPRPVRVLMRVASLKCLAESIGISYMGYQKGQIILYPLEAGRKTIHFLQGKYPSLIYKPKNKTFCFAGISGDNSLAFLERVFSDII